MTLYSIKPAFQALLRPLMFFLDRHGVTANHITLTAIIMSLFAGALLIIIPYHEIFFLLPAVLFIRMALNALDGMLARECNQASRLGAILNEIGDVISDIALYLPFIFVAGSQFWLVLALLFGTVLTEFCGLLAQTLNQTRSYAGPLGKSDRALLFGCWGLCLALWPTLAPWSNLVWIAAILLLIWTAINRCRSAMVQESER
jgi:phosphatidylglycerophosphate synthase